MQDKQDDSRSCKVVLDDHAVDYKIEGFTEQYVLYHNEVMSEAPPTYIISWPLKGLGVLLFIVGALTILLGPSYVTVDFSGPTFFQLIQLYPGPIVTVGSLVFAAGAWVERTTQEEFMSPEDFLRCRYSFVGPQGDDLENEIVVRHIDQDNFHISSVDLIVDESN